MNIRLGPVVLLFLGFILLGIGGEIIGIPGAIVSATGGACLVLALVVAIIEIKGSKSSAGGSRPSGIAPSNHEEYIKLILVSGKRMTENLEGIQKL